MISVKEHLDDGRSVREAEMTHRSMLLTKKLLHEMTAANSRNEVEGSVKTDEGKSVFETEKPALFAAFLGEKDTNMVAVGPKFRRPLQNVAQTGSEPTPSAETPKSPNPSPAPRPNKTKKISIDHYGEFGTTLHRRRTDLLLP